MSKRQLYLIGGLGNNLFQIDKALGFDPGEVQIITNLIDDKFYSTLFGWSFHNEAISSGLIDNDIQIKRFPALVVLWHLLLLFFVKKLQRPVLGVSWDSNELTKVNFGYWQSKEKIDNKNVRLKLNSGSKRIKGVTICHFRLGDSPTQNEDYLAQIELIRSLDIGSYIFVTNDKHALQSRLAGSEIHYEIRQGNVLEDLNLLLSAETLIIPRSTFSLIAALTSKNLIKLYVPSDYWEDYQRNLNGVEIWKY